MNLRRFWIEFPSERARLGMGWGCGVTAFDRDDALGLAAAAAGGTLPSPVRVIDDVDVSTLDPGHVLPNMLPPNERGVWFPWARTGSRAVLWGIPSDMLDEHGRSDVRRDGFLETKIVAVLIDPIDEARQAVAGHLR